MSVCFCRLILSRLICLSFLYASGDMVLNFPILSAFKNERNCCTGNSTNLGYLTTTCYIYTRRSYFASVIFCFLCLSGSITTTSRPTEHCAYIPRFRQSHHSHPIDRVETRKHCVFELPDISQSISQLYFRQTSNRTAVKKLNIYSDVVWLGDKAHILH